MAEPTTEQLAAGQAKGLTPAQCSYLRGETPDELSADADALLTEFAPPPPPAIRSGGPRGGDVASTSPGTVSAGVAMYRQKHGLDEDGNRPEKKAVPTSDRNPFAVRTYTMDGR
ncbi:hypothetical protein OG735_07045 [Streptomyces sp. NBC_01210]|uniref:hypothetical protein n=1 Tax=Streptomyces sp. NBC_01210 TaxID=2903774 RepID=UPI002E117897|nr:hypothetical protein OG735_07045 [Streptomyces sp. NBC_01210]